MMGTFRKRVSHATCAGLLGAGVTVCTQLLVGIPVGRQPDWLTTLSSGTMMPAQYVLYPLSSVLGRVLGTGDGRLLEATTPFGPALRLDLPALALVALATIVMVGLVDYLAQGVTALWEEHRHARWPVLN